MTLHIMPYDNGQPHTYISQYIFHTVKHNLRILCTGTITRICYRCTHSVCTVTKPKEQESEQSHNRTGVIKIFQIARGGYQLVLF